MPKRGAGRPSQGYYIEHDNRGEEVRRVSFKPNSCRRDSAPSGVRDRRDHREHRDRSKWQNAVRNHLQLDQDVDMAGGQRNQFGRGGGGVGGRGGNRIKGGRPNRGRQNSPVPMRTFRRLPPSSSYWYKVILPHGGEYDKKWILDSLLSGIAPVTFTPIIYKIQHKEATFFIDNTKAAEKLQNLDRRIPTEDGYKLGIKVKPWTPTLDFNDDVKEALKITMNKRFIPDTNALNLSRLHADPDVADRFIVPLNRVQVLSSVMTMVVDNCPSLRALDLSHNNIVTLEGLKSLVARLSNLRILHMTNNQIIDMKSLDSLKGLDLEELMMDSNPVCAKYGDQGAYVSDVRKRLPKLRKLDGVELPPPILFDVEESRLPESKGSFLCAEEGKEMARQFLEQYYALYDGGNREPLKDAYHENAMFSMSCQYLPGQTQQNQGNREKNSLNAYFSSSRNLKRVLDLDQRVRRLISGHTEIIKFLCALPNSQHDPLSFAVDLMLFTPQLIQLCVSGVFRETHSVNTGMRAFSRSLVIIPQGQGFCIVNETLYITNATPAQAAAAFKTSLPPSAPALTPAPAVVVPVVPLMPAPVVQGSSSDLEAKRQMVEHLARVSGMNLGWSEKCLNETNWNLDQAVFVFTELNKQGTIPAEAFVK